MAFGDLSDNLSPGACSRGHREGKSKSKWSSFETKSETFSYFKESSARHSKQQKKDGRMPSKKKQIQSHFLSISSLCCLQLSYCATVSAPCCGVRQWSYWTGFLTKSILFPVLIYKHTTTWTRVIIFGQHPKKHYLMYNCTNTLIFLLHWKNNEWMNALSQMCPECTEDLRIHCCFINGLIIQHEKGSAARLIFPHFRLKGCDF